MPARPEESDNTEGEARREEEELLGELESLLEDEGQDPGPDARWEEESPDDPEPGEQKESRLSTFEARSQRRQRDLGELRNLEGLMGRDVSELVVSDDRLVARLRRVDSHTTQEGIDALLQRHDIRHGIDRGAIQEALRKAARGQIQHGVVVARGTAPKTIEGARIDYRQGLKEAGRAIALLLEAMESPTPEPFYRWAEPLPVVRPGEVLAEIRPAWVEPGRDIYGVEISASQETSLKLRTGVNVSMTVDGRCCVAEIYGYAGVVDGEVVVLPPLWISGERLEARYVHLPAVAPHPGPPSLEDLHNILQQCWIEHGIIDKQVRHVHEQLARGQNLLPTVLLAQGTRPIIGEKAQIHYAFDAERALTWGQLQSILRSPDEKSLRAALEELLEDRGLLFYLARRGEWLAEKIPATDGVPGRDVEGDEISAESGEDVPLEVGDYLTMGEDGMRCRTDICAYACLRLNQLNLVPPIWVAPDASSAFFVNLPQGEDPTYPQVEDMLELVDIFGIRHGFSPQAWHHALQELESGRLDDLLVPIARATPPRPGKDAEFVWDIDIEGNRVGKILEDGSIDFRERRLTTVVRAGDLLGVLTSARRGEPGIDVLGRESAAPSPVNIEVITDNRVRAEEREDGTYFFAETGGGVQKDEEMRRTRQRLRRRLRIGISLISSIDGDVDFTTGNIDFNGDVVISGSVQSLFSVKADGAVSIGGYVESGAFIAAGKDVIIKGGILGASTEVVAGGSIMAKYVQESSLRAGGDVQAGAYIFNASIRARGRVRVLGRGEGKSRALVGGLVWAGKGIEASSVGSPYNTGTRLVAGVDPEQLNRLEQLRANLQACEVRQEQLLEKLGLGDLDVDSIRQKLRGVRSEERRRELLLGIKKITRIAELEMALRREMEEIAQAQQDLARLADICVQNRLFSGVEVRIGEEVLLISEDRERVRLRLQQDNGHVRIHASALR